MADRMDFPATVEEFMEQYKITDTEQVYTNRAELIPIFRMKQWFEHQPSADVVQVVHGRWIKYTGMGKMQWMCSECSAEEKNPKVANYCYHCGAKMDAQGEE